MTLKKIKSIGVALLLLTFVLTQNPSNPATESIQNSGEQLRASDNANILQDIPKQDQPVVPQGQGIPTIQNELNKNIPSAQPVKTEQGKPIKNPLDVDEHETKQRIKKLLGQMDKDQLQHFQSQLAGDARKYYDDIMTETVKHMAEQEQQYQQAEQELVKQQTPSQLQSGKQTKVFNSQWEKYSDRDINYNEYLFTVDQTTTEDFRISIPVGQLVTFYGFVYQNKDGVYSVPTEVEGKDPVWIYVYENNHKIVYQQEFYFKYFGAFQGNDNTSYLIRFVNPSDHKMIAFNLAVLFQIGHSAEKLTAVDVADHGRRIKITQEQLNNRLKDSYSRNVFESQNRERLLDKMERYYIYSIVQICIIAVLCVMQVQFARKLLSTTSVV